MSTPSAIAACTAARCWEKVGDPVVVVHLPVVTEHVGAGAAVLGDHQRDLGVVPVHADEEPVNVSGAIGQPMSV